MSPEDLYWVGYLRADGCFKSSKTSTVISFGQVHREPVERLALYLGSRVNEYFCGSGYREEKFHQWYTSSTNKVAFFKEIGLKGKLEPSIYQSVDFWRGMIDGDGTLCDKRPALQLVGSYEDLEHFAKYLSQFDINVSVYDHGPVHRVIFSGNKAIVATRIIYSGTSYLEYKKLKAGNIKKRTLSDHPNAWKPTC
jgi:hypothetical protein